MASFSKGKVRAGIKLPVRAVSVRVRLGQYQLGIWFGKGKVKAKLT